MGNFNEALGHILSSSTTWETFPSNKQAWTKLWFIQAYWLVISLLSHYLPLEKGTSPSFEQTWIPSPQGCLEPYKLGWNWPGASGKVVHFHYVDITSHWEGMWPSNLKKTLIPSPKDVGQNFAFSPGKLKRGLTLLCFAYHAVYHQFSESSMH